MEKLNKETLKKPVKEVNIRFLQSEIPEKPIMPRWHHLYDRFIHVVLIF